jgi:aryl-alcohol dehydrogenase-like predicted oxidoreductase
MTRSRDSNYDKVEALESWAKDRGHSMVELAHAWLLAHPAVSSVISGATKLEQVQANAASADWKLSQAELEEVNKILGD